MYFFVLFLSSKVLSRPFHIWYIPLISLFPFIRTRQQIASMALALLMIVLDTTPWIKLPDVRIWGVLALDRLRDAARFTPMMVLVAFIPRWKTPS
jgi:hypothetical protein